MVGYYKYMAHCNNWRPQNMKSVPQSLDQSRLMAKVLRMEFAIPNDHIRAAS